MKIVGPRQSPPSSPTSRSAPKPSQSAADGKVRGPGTLADILPGGGRRYEASGASMRTGGSNSDNRQTVTCRPSKDGFEPPGAVKVQATRGGISTGRGSDNVMLSDDRSNGGGFAPKPTPGTWNKPGVSKPVLEKPLRSIGDLLRRLFEGLTPRPAPAPGSPVEGGPGLTAGADKIQVKWSPIRVGGSHADNIFKGPYRPGDKERPTDGSFAPPSKPGSRLEQLLERLFPSGRPAQVMGRADKPGLTHANNVLMNHHPGNERNVR